MPGRRALLTVPTGRTRVAGVIGDPVEHSLSPVLHNAAFAALGIDWVYVAFHVAAGQGGGAIEAMRTLDLAGLSVTMPHKADAAAEVDVLGPVAEQLGVINTVSWSRTGTDATLVGDSTDGAGYLDSLRGDEGFDPAGRACTIFGCGGAARAVTLALAGAGAVAVTVVGRRPEAAAACAALAGPAGRWSAGGEPGAIEAAVGGAELLVNATPAGMGRAPRPAVRAGSGLAQAVTLRFRPWYTPPRPPRCSAPPAGPGPGAPTAWACSSTRPGAKWSCGRGVRPRSRPGRRPPSGPAPTPPPEAPDRRPPSLRRFHIHRIPTMPIKPGDAPADRKKTISLGGFPVSLKGSLQTVALPEVLQFLADTGKSGEFHVAGGHGDGRLWFADGRICGYDEARAAEAYEAIFEMMRIADADFEFAAGAERPIGAHETAPTEVGPAIEAAESRMVEWRQIVEVVPSLEHRIQLRADAPGERVILEPEQWRTVVGIAGGCTVGALIESRELQEFAGCQAVRTLVDARLVDVLEPLPAVDPAEPAVAVDDSPSVDNTESESSFTIEVPFGAGGDYQVEPFSAQSLDGTSGSSRQRPRATRPSHSWTRTPSRASCCASVWILRSDPIIKESTPIWTRPTANRPNPPNPSRPTTTPPCGRPCSSWETT